MPRLVTRSPYLLLGLACLASALLYLTALLLKPYVHAVVDELIREVVEKALLIIAVALAVHLIERAWFLSHLLNELRSEVIAPLHSEVRGQLEAYRETLVDAAREKVVEPLRTEIARMAGAQELLRSSQRSGLVALHASRRQAKEHIERRVTTAERRIWVIGVVLTEVLQFTALRSPLEARLAAGVDVRLLLLDPLRSPAVFRLLLETPKEAALDILDEERPCTYTSDPIWSQRLFSDFEAMYRELSQHRQLIPHVRYYGHDPGVWMVLVDDRAFVEPYTFGRRPACSISDSWLAAQMPVFEFAPGSQEKPFEVLMDHFDKLWKTSDVDWFHIGSRREASERVLSDLFSRRREWLRHVWMGLWNERPDAITKPRLAPRQRCEDSPSDLRIRPVNANGEGDPAKILDKSLGGLRLEVAQNGGQYAVGDLVQLLGGKETRLRAAKWLLEELRKRGGNRFRVIWSRQNERHRLTVGLAVDVPANG